MVLSEATLIPVSVVGVIITSTLVIMNDRATVKERLIKIEVQLDMLMRHFGLKIKDDK